MAGSIVAAFAGQNAADITAEFEGTSLGRQQWRGNQQDDQAPAHDVFPGKIIRGITLTATGAASLPSPITRTMTRMRAGSSDGGASGAAMSITVVRCSLGV